jgi:peptide/nickel transport system ATP-binding protein
MTATAASSAPATEAGPTPVCELEDLVMHFGPVRAVDGVSLRIDPGQVVALVGESGSGKSTVGRCVVRLLEPTGGTVRLNGVDVTHLSRRELRRHRRAVSIVFQDPASSLDPRLDVGSVIGEPLRLQGAGRGDRRQRVAEMLERVGLRRSVAERYPHELSGGQRQRVSIARALVSQPALLVADEPTSALDLSVQASVLNLLTDLQRDLGFACLFITHDLSAVEYLADDVAVMYLGVLAEYGPREQVFESPKHPYTQALLSAAPLPDPVAQRRRRRVVLSGDIPTPLAPPPGCRFHTRCPVADHRSRTEVPLLRPVAGRLVACHQVDDAGNGPDVRLLPDEAPAPSGGQNP